MGKAIKICAIIPVFNEEKSIKEVVEKTLNFVDNVILVNDGSTDNTLLNLPSNPKIIVISHKNKLGKGSALRTGFYKALEIKSDLTVTIDGDLQHNPSCIPEFIDKVKNFDIVIGNRLNDKTTMPIHRRLSNFLTSKLLSIKTKIEILDSQCGFRLYRTKILKNIIPDENGFEAESKILINAAKYGYKIGFVNIPTIYNRNNSKMNSLGATIGFIKVLISK